jgi:hypothetical protein
MLEAKRKGDSLKAFDCHEKPPGLYADTLSDCKVNIYYIVFFTFYILNITPKPI